MQQSVSGLHHITAIARSAQRNYDFYTKVLGLRLVKKTVNFDDPETYHLYYGNESGEPGTILTFFPWEGIGAGHAGTGMATEIGYSVPTNSLDFWKARFDQYKTKYEPTADRFGEKLMVFEDPDGLQMHLTEPKSIDDRKAWTTNDVTEKNAIKGFHSVTLTLKNIKATAEILTDVFGYRFQEQQDNRHRFVNSRVSSANLVDLVEKPDERIGYVAGGTNHHVAFRVESDAILAEFRERIAARGLHITHKIDRSYFFSLYFREPGGVLFELASANPGFTVDEPLSELGMHLKLPAQYEPMRSDIEKILAPLK